MDIKLRRSNKPLYISAIVICVMSFLTSIVGFLGAMRINSLTGYQDLISEGTNGKVYDSLQNALTDVGVSVKQMEAFSHQMHVWVTIAIIASVFALVSIIYLVVAVGDRDEEGNIIINGFDKIFSELQILAIAFVFILGGTTFIDYTYDTIGWIGYRRWIQGDYSYMYAPTPVDMAFSVLLGIAAAALGLALVLSCIKKVKAKEFVNQSILGKLFHIVFYGGSMMRKVVLIAICICVLSATVFLAPVMLIVILVFAPKWVRKYENIKKGIEEVNGGNLTYKIPIEGDDEFDCLAQGINQITEATSSAVENEVKNQRMKTDLISNVSHDLKTPLTSMVTYIDLLKTEGLDSEAAPEYLAVLEQKTNRLRQLTEDLFEAAKASSGAIPVRMGRVDLLSLLNQGLGEMNQKVEAAALDVIIHAEEDHYMVNADGQLLWRVVENLLSNVIKYSQENTRVYVNVLREETIEGLDTMVFLEMKNISKHSLNIDPSELTERFKRGDESRTTEGSGLGLAISKDLLKLMGGWIEVIIDGDLFKVRVMLTEAQEEMQTVPEEFPINGQESMEIELAEDYI